MFLTSLHLASKNEQHKNKVDKHRKMRLAATMLLLLL
jgi:hypothetical protein